MKTMSEWNQSAASTPSTQSGDELTGPLTLAPMGPEETLGIDQSVVPSRKSLPSGVILLVAVLAVAAGTLYMMRLGGNVDTKPQAAASSAELQIEQALAILKQPGLLAEADADDPQVHDTEGVIALFVDDPTAKQVPLENLQKNPFAMGNGPQKTADGVTTVANVVDRTQQLLMMKLHDEFKRLQLQSVMNGQSPMAVISGKVVREGDKLGSFRVATIEPMAVLLTAESNSYRLTMADPADQVHSD